LIGDTLITGLRLQHLIVIVAYWENTYDRLRRTENNRIKDIFMAVNNSERNCAVNVLPTAERLAYTLPAAVGCGL